MNFATDDSSHEYDYKKRECERKNDSSAKQFNKKWRFYHISCHITIFNFIHKFIFKSPFLWPSLSKHTH